MIPRRRSTDRWGWLLLMALVGLLMFAGAVSLAGCADPIMATRSAIATASSVQHDAVDQFKAWDRPHQLELARAAADMTTGAAALEQYRDKRKAVVAAAKDLYASNRAAEVATNMVEAGLQSKDKLPAIVGALMKQVNELLQAIRLAGLDLGGF